MLVDEVDYKDSAPWPGGADGFGLSLQRRNTAPYGNDPAAWKAAPPTAAGLNPQSGTPPTITTQPVNQAVVASSTVMLGVSATGDAPLRYQWRFNGANLAGATNSTLQLSGVQQDDAGDYKVVVFNNAGSIVSSNATVTVITAASILVQPQSQTVFPLTSASFSVLAFSSTPLSYQWRFNGGNISGATNGSYNISSVQPSDDGQYSVLVTDAVGSTLSGAARLSVLLHPVWTVQPTNRTIIVGTGTTGATFTASANSTTPVKYQWRFSGANLPGATSASLLVTNVQRANAGDFAGDYSVVATDNYGSIASTNATLTVLLAAIFTQHPVGQTAVAGSSVTFSASASGTPPMSFRWRRGGTTLGGTPNANGVIIGTNFNGFIAVTPFYSFVTLANLKTNDGATFTVVITNIAGPAQNSAVAGGLSSNAVLTVLVDTDLDGLPDDFQAMHPGVVGAGDEDGDGMLNAAEYFAGTDPFDPTSNLKGILTGPNAGTVQFIAVSNRTYTVQYTDGLTPSRWKKLGDVLAQSITRTQSVVDPNPRTNRLYRIVTPAQP